MTGRVYFILDGHGRIKIGYSTDPDARLRALQISHASSLTMLGHVPGTHATEREMHKRFADRRLSGEWFQADDDVRRCVDDLLARPPLPLSPPRGPANQDIIERCERLIEFFRGQHPENTIAEVARKTGVRTNTVSQWFHRPSLPNGEVALHLIAIYGPRFLLDGMGISDKWVHDAIAEEAKIKARDAVRSALDALEALERATATEILADAGLTLDAQIAALQARRAAL